MKVSWDDYPIYEMKTKIFQTTNQYDIGIHRVGQKWPPLVRLSRLPLHAMPCMTAMVARAKKPADSLGG